MSVLILTLGKLAFAAIGAAVGWKLASNFRRSGELGLHTLALAAICLGGFGLAAMPLSAAIESPPSPSRPNSPYE